MQSIADTPALLNERITAIVHALATDATVPADQLLPLLTDISAYLQQQNEHNYRLFFELARVPILLIDPETRQIKNANRAAENFYGYSREQLLQLCITDINCLTPQQIREEMAHAEAERRAFFLFPHRLASGEIRQVEVHSGPIIIDGHEYLYSTIYDITERQQALIQLRDSEARYRALHDSLPVGCLTQDAEHNILAINDEACVIFGVDRAQLQNNNLASMPWVRVRENGEPLSLDEHPAVECLRTRTPVRGFIMGLKSEHHTVWLSVNSQPLYHPGETEPYAVISTFSDISELKQIEEKLSLAASVFTEAREAIMITDADARIVQINNAFCDITGYSQDEVLGQNPRLLQSGYQDTAFYHAFWRQLLEVGHWSGEIWNRRKNGDIFAEQQTISAVKNAKNETHHYVSLFSDISDRKQYEKQLEQQAFYDQLTGLPNRAQLTDKLTLAIQQNNHALTQLCVAYIDLDGFKQINDTYGHAIGDQVLVTIAQRMKKVLRGTDVVARLGGDEFVALFTVNQERPWLHLVTRLLNSIAKTLSIGTLPLNVSASIGLTFYQQASNLTAEQLLAQADQAMYQAKQAGRNQYQLYEAKLH